MVNVCYIYPDNRLIENKTKHPLFRRRPVKKTFLTFLLTAPMFLCGCSLTGKIGGWDIWSATATSVVIVNNTADLSFAVFVNGRPQNKYLVGPGEHFPVALRNFGDQRKEFSVLVKAYTAEGKVYGVTTASFSLGQYEARAKTWEIKTRDLEKRE